MLSPAECAALPDLPIPAHARIARTDKPVFFGHYWLTGTPALQTAKHVCVDYSAGKGGPLVAYRFDGQPDLSPEEASLMGRTDPEEKHDKLGDSERSRTGKPARLLG